MFRIIFFILFFTVSSLARAITIRDIQYTTAQDGSSPKLDQHVNVEGIVSYVDRHGYIISDPGGGPWSSVYVYDHGYRPDIGDKISIGGTVQEYFGFTELADIDSYQKTGTGTITPVEVNCSEIRSEKYESVLVKINTVTIVNDSVGGNVPAWQVSDGSGTVNIGDRLYYYFIPEKDKQLTSVTGILWYTWEDYYIMPRNDDDLGGYQKPEFALKGIVITPHGPEKDYYVHISNGKIVYVGSTQPAVKIINTDGIIFPGLIDSHNHPSYNSFPTLQFDDQTLTDRYQWRSCSEYDDWKGLRGNVRGEVGANDNARISKWGEILELMAGCVAIQGNYDDRVYAHPEVIIKNVEEFPSRTAAEINPMNLTQDDANLLKTGIANGVLKAFIIHLSEGTDQSSLDEFYALKDDLGLLNNTIAIIHGVPYGKTEFDYIAAAGAKLIWSPMSNMRLYGQTANVKAAKESGVTIALAPDWTPSGRYNILEELNFASYLNQSMFGGVFTNAELCNMITINAAIACGIDNEYGKIKTGYSAGICVIAGDPDKPYESLINARPKDVMLTVVDGFPKYGNSSVMNELGITGEKVVIGGVEKTFDIARRDPLVPYSGETVQTIRQSLKQAHENLNPTAALNPDEIQFLDFELIENGPDNVKPFASVNPLIKPAANDQIEVGKTARIEYNNKEFWDNATITPELKHRIEIVEKDSPNTVKQVVKNDYLNTKENSSFEFTPNFHSVSQKLYLIKFVTSDRNGNERIVLCTDNPFTVEPGNVSVDEKPESGGLKILKAFPNPAVVDFKILLSSGNSGCLRAELLNLNGNRITTFADVIIDSGRFELDCSLNGLSAGVYFYRIIFNKQSYSGVVIKN